MTYRIYLGYDERLPTDWKVAAKSARKYGPEIEVIKLQERRLRMLGMLTRTVDRRGQTMHDFESDAPQSTEFAASRFWVPLLAHSGWVLFGDSNIIFLKHPRTVFEYADPTKAVMVVKHGERKAEDL